MKNMAMAFFVFMIGTASFAQQVNGGSGDIGTAGVRGDEMTLKNGSICGVSFNTARVKNHLDGKWSTLDQHIATRVHGNVVICKIENNNYAMVLQDRFNVRPGEYDTLVIYTRLYKERN